MRHVHHRGSGPVISLSILLIKLRGRSACRLSVRAIPRRICLLLSADFQCGLPCFSWDDPSHWAASTAKDTLLCVRGPPQFSTLTFRCPSWETVSSGLFGSNHPVALILPISVETPLTVKPCPEKVLCGCLLPFGAGAVTGVSLGNNIVPGRSRRGRSQRPRGLVEPHFCL